MSTWKIVLRDSASCVRAYRRPGNETKETSCTVKGITWVSSPSQPLAALQIDPVTIMHDGSYTCEIATPGGNFHCHYDLRVLVPPEVSLVGTEPGTAVCQALSGKPAAQISWTPEGNCDPAQVTRGNGTVSVRSKCRWKDSNVSTVICSVSHVTGNRNLSLELHSDENSKGVSSTLYISLPIFAIFIITILSICIFKTTTCRKWKPTQAKRPQDCEEDEMQPYACYMEKSNPLYDTTNKGKMSHVLQNEAARMDFHAS
ncbi:cell surface glycoprotein CD200 receptor 1 [Echinops telfairi]|uniref:Cell surface glycoprotein CD200 receptor 1 n=1 Tax=Echinops telfairi TaxID=9371 RepID=A0ABM0IS67_ECHTE|nr:cell surface glycoprotein CD200 receptor 1 [Echinops telfairi]